MKKKRHLIGIDPSFKTMGVAVWTPEERRLVFKSGKLQHCVSWLFKGIDMKEVIIVCENPNLDSPHYTLWNARPFFVNDQKIKGVTRTIFGFKNVVTSCIRTSLRSAGRGRPDNLPITINHVQSMFASAVRQAQDIGKSKAAAEYVIDIFRDRGVQVVEIAPSERHRADKTSKKNPRSIDMKKWPTKTTRAQFEQYSGLKIGARDSNEHSRDAATLVVKRTIQSVELQGMEQNLKRQTAKNTRKRLKDL